MKQKEKTAFFIFLGVDVVLMAISVWLVLTPSLPFGNIVLFNPKGVIAQKEMRLMAVATLLMLTVAIPVFALLFVFARKYRAGNTLAKYSPNLQSSPAVALALWAIPAFIIFLIAVINWKSTHELDPYKPIASGKKPITIQVVALQWKWLFIYPEQNIATVNFIQFPEATPVNFQLTADAPMNSFWIPQLGGQMYAMPGMETQLHLIAEKSGEFAGSDAEISGAGFAGMKFTAKSSSQADFNAWVAGVKKGQNILSFEAYNQLAQPSKNSPKTFYATVETNLYNKVMMKFMAPVSNGQTTNSTSPPMNMQGMGTK